MTTRDELIVKFTADIADFNRRLSEVQTKVTTLNTNVSKQADSIGGSFKKIGGYLGAYFSAQALMGFTSSVINLAERFIDLSAATGISAEALQRLNYAAIDSGVSLETIVSAVQKLQLNLGSGNKKTLDVLEALGLDAETLKQQSPEKQLLIIIQQLKQVQDVGLRSAASNALFGRTYREMAKLVAQDTEEIKKAMEEGPVVPQQALDNVDEFKDNWEKFKTEIQLGVIPAMSDLLSVVADLYKYQREKFNIGMLFSGEDSHNSIKAEINRAKFSLQGNNLSEQKRKELEAYVRILENSTTKIESATEASKKAEAAAAPEVKKGSLKEAVKSGKGVKSEIEKTADAYKSRAEAIKQNTSSLYALQQAEKEIQDLMKDGYLTKTEAADAIKKLNDDYNELSRTLADDLTEAINRPIRSFADFREIALDALQKIAVQAAITAFKLDTIPSSFGGQGMTTGIGSWLGEGIGSLFGGFFAEGGEPPLNRPSIVGERGAELFVPKVAGRIIPNDQIGGGGGVHYSIMQNLNFALGVQDTVRAEIMRMMPAINRTTQESIVEANRRGGSMSIIMNNRS